MGPILKNLADEDLVTAKDTPNTLTISLDEGYPTWGIARVKVSKDARKYSTFIVMLVQLMKPLGLPLDSESTVDPLLLGVASAENFYRAFAFYNFFEASQSGKTTELWKARKAICANSARESYNFLLDINEHNFSEVYETRAGRSRTLWNADSRA